MTDKDIPKWLAENEVIFRGMGDEAFNYVLKNAEIVETAPVRTEGPHYVILASTFPHHGHEVWADLSLIPKEDQKD